MISRCGAEISFRQEDINKSFRKPFYTLRIYNCNIYCKSKSICRFFEATTRFCANRSLIRSIITGYRRHSSFCGVIFMSLTVYMRSGIYTGHFATQQHEHFRLAFSS